MTKNSTTKSNSKAFLGILCVLLFLGILFGATYRNSPNRAVNLEKFQTALNAKEAEAVNTMQNIREILDNEPINALINYPFPNRGISYFVIADNELIFWSDNQLDISGLNIGDFYRSHFVHLPNAYAVLISIEYDNVYYVALITIKYDYPYENDKLINRFAQGFDMNKRVEVKIGEKSDEFAVFCRNGTYLFSLAKPETAIFNEFWSRMASVMFGLAFLLFFFAYARFPLFIGRKTINLKKFSTLFLVLGAALAAFLYFNIPEVFLSNKLFSPFDYSSNAILSSIAHLSMVTVFVFSSAYLFFFHVKTEKMPMKAQFALLVLYPLYFIALYCVLRSLVFDSTIVLNILRTNDFSFLGIVAHFLIFIWGIGFVFIFYRTHQYFASKKILSKAMLFDAVFVILMLIFCAFSDQFSIVLVVLPYILLSLVFYAFYLYQQFRNSYFFLIAWVLLFALFVSWNISSLNIEQNTERYRLLAKNIALSSSMENDPLTVYFLESMNERLKDDAGISEMRFADLLIPSAANIQRQLNISIAKYENQSLIYSSGIIEYPDDASWISDFAGANSKTIVFENHRHYIYLSDSDQLIIITPNQRNSLSDYLQFFIYLAVVYFILSWFLIRFYLYFYDRENYRLGLAERFQYIFISLLIISFSAIFYISVDFIRENYKRKQIENLENVRIYIQNALQSMYFFNEELTIYNTLDLDFDLWHLSRVYRTDIHVFDNNGVLVGSSQPRIFYYNLISNLMSPRVFFSENPNIEQYEHIGKLEYLTAYTHFYNGDGVPIGFIAVPQFFSEEAMRAEIENFSSVILHVYFLIILIAVFLTVFIGRRLSAPLSMLERKMKEMRLGHRNEKIEYKHNDEIGQLVAQYNNTVEELEQSAKLLAKSERESAWKLMARQIAHEINNPLTPMKLSIQQLQRRKGMTDDGFDEYFKNTTTMLIEQIDNLSRIAGTFSDFARMPEAKYEQVNVNAVLQSVVRLFTNYHPKTTIDFHDTDENIIVYADSEQLIQVFNNLIKNAVQSIPSDRKGKVEINLIQTESSIEIRISDNGIGVSKENQDKVFTPNFTTKAQGTGLGLVISKKIIEQLGGTIRFETEEGKGSVFMVEIPREEF